MILFDNLVLDLKKRFQALEKRRAINSTYELSNILMSGFALFSVKDRSLLKFTKELANRATNLKNIFHITQTPSDTTIRTLLDEVPTQALKPLFKPYLEELEAHQVWKDYKYIGDHLFIPVDGTQYFKSKTICCEHCQTKKQGGTITYHHNALAAVVVSPKYSEVFPVSIEDMVKQDGNTKNDSELAAFRRLVPQIRHHLRDQKIIIGGDALFANGPAIRLLQKTDLDMRFLFSVKPGSQSYLFLQVDRLKAEGKMKTFTKTTKVKKYITTYAPNLMLNGVNNDISVNFIHFEEHHLKTGQVKVFHWITDLPITAHNYVKLVKGGRARWKIENETFNTLKNQGYQFEHNFGHGKKNLAANFSVLMLLAFLFDQIQQRTNLVFLAARRKAGSTITLWEKVRQLLDLVIVDSMQTIYKIIAKEIKLKIQLII